MSDKEVVTTKFKDEVNKNLRPSLWDMTKLYGPHFRIEDIESSGWHRAINVETKDGKMLWIDIKKSDLDQIVALAKTTGLEWFSATYDKSREAGNKWIFGAINKPAQISV